MKLSRKSGVIKAGFGKFLRKVRLDAERSLFDDGYILGVSPQTVFLWEMGFSFPGSIVLLKKLAVMYPGVPGALKDVARRSGIAPSASEWREFERKIGLGRGGMVSGVSPNYVSKDKRDSEYKRAFGKYLIKERYGREITFVAMARALGINRNTYCAWENGSAWPQEVMTLAILDRLYGNTFDVLFDLCEKNGIKLSMAESKDVLKKIKVFEGTKRGQRGNGWFREELAA